MDEQAPLYTCKAHLFQVDPDTRKAWLPLSTIAVNVQIFHNSVKNIYRILSVHGSKVLINTIVTPRMTVTKTSQKFCQWVDSRSNQVYGLGFAHENDLARFMEKFMELKEATRNILRSSSVDARQTIRSDIGGFEQSSQLKQENAQLKLALAQSSSNANKWQDELEVLRNNNAKLTTALQESHTNVEEWKRQLQFYRDECSRLRQIVSSRHSPSGRQVNEKQGVNNLFNNADRRNKEQEQKIFQLENQVQRYITEIGSLKDRLTEIEADNQGLCNALQRHTSSIHTSRTAPRSPHRNRQQLIRLRDLFESKTNEFNQTLTTKSQDLQRLCSQITHTINEL